MRICRESLLTKAHGRSCCGRKGASAPFSCLPARTGSGRARKQVKGLVPCGFSGQRPEPSESFLMLRSAIFKVLLSLFFSARFFIDHLTLPSHGYMTLYRFFFYFMRCPARFVISDRKRPPQDWGLPSPCGGFFNLPYIILQILFFLRSLHLR